MAEYAVRGGNRNALPVRKGVFQGDPLSPIVFIMCFNPIIEYLETQKQQYGYDFAGPENNNYPVYMLINSTW